MNVGGVANIGYRWDVARLFYVEPIGTLSYAWTHVNSYNVPGLAPPVRGWRELARWPRREHGINWFNTATYEADTSLAAVDQFVARNPVSFLDTNPDPNAIPLTLSDKVSRVYGELTASATIINKGVGWSAYANGGMQFSDQFTILSGTAGVRYQW